jgi:hypothetical protein
MPGYRVRYVCETSLKFDNDVALKSRGSTILFLFSQKRPEEKSVHLLVDVEGANYRDADVKAQSILQPGLDALAFSTGSPLLVLHWDFILKDETGSKTRRAIWCEKTREPAPKILTERAIAESQQILEDEEESSLELCWHRYALQRNLILDRFVFQWLAFEGLAGKKQIPTICPHCKAEVTHCDKPLLHEGSNANKAHELFLRIEAANSLAEFKRDIWGRARNAVFHGIKYPSPEFLSGLQSLSPKIRQACDVEFNRMYELGEGPRPVQDIEFHVYRTNMFEWQTANAANSFADDFPWEAVKKEFGEMQSGEVRSGFPETWPFTLLNFNRESENW